MSALQHLVGIILFHGNASKQVSTGTHLLRAQTHSMSVNIYLMQTQRRLAHLQMCVSTTSTLKKMDELRHDHDGPVRAWKDRIEKTLKGKRQKTSLYTSIINISMTPCRKLLTGPLSYSRGKYS